MRGHADAGKLTLITCMNLWKMETQLFIRGHAGAGMSILLTCV